MNLINDAEENLKKEPLKEPTNEPYRRIALNGKLEDRKVLVNGTQDGTRGHYIIQPYELNGRRFLIQRGFAKEGKLLNTTSDEGLIMKNEEQGYRPDNKDNLWLWKDVHAISKQFNTEPILIGMLKKGEHSGGIEAKPAYSNNHMQYILTWFSISLITAALIKFRKPTKPKFHL